VKTYTKQLSSNPASVVQRARRMAKRQGLFVKKFRSPVPYACYAGGFSEYWCDNQLFKDIDHVIDYLSEEEK
jgi:hypothetical protein